MADSAPSALSLIAFGLSAGLVGAAAMLVSQKIEMAASGREPSPTPATAAEKLSGIEVDSEEREAELSTAMHFAFGTGLGLGLVLVDRVPAIARAPLFAAGAWSIGTGVLVALGIAKPPTQWKRAQLATDVGHHAVYGLSAAAAYEGARRLATARR